jgi:YD repeat-containing protein
MYQPAAFTLAILLCTVHLQAQLVWLTTNGPEGGDHSTVDVAADGPNILVVTHWNFLKGNGVGGHLRYSGDGGSSWQSAEGALTPRAVYRLAQRPGTAETTVLLLDSFQLLSPTAFLAVHHGPSDGSDWQLRSSTAFPAGDPVMALRYSTGGDTLFAGLRTGGVRFSVNTGASWQPLNTGLPNMRITAFAWDGDGALLAATDSAAGQAGGVMRLTSSGWIDISAGLPATGVGHIAVDALTNTRYAGLRNFQAGTGAVYRWQGQGPWQPIWAATGAEVGGLALDGAGTLHAVLFRAGVHSFIGNTWTNTTQNLPTNWLRTITTLPDGGMAVLGRSGLWIRPPGTGPWTYRSVASRTNDVKGLAFTTTGALLAATTDGVYRSVDQGGNWSNQALRDTFLFTVAQHPVTGRIFTGSNDNSEAHIRYSTDDGVSWIGNDPGFISTRVLDFAFLPSGRTLCGTGWQRPVSWSDDGSQWTGGFWSMLGFSAGTVSIALAVDDAGRIFSGTEIQGVLRSIDGGATYQWVGFGGGDVTDIAISPDQRVFVTHATFNPPVGNLYRSSDHGTTWTTNLLPNAGFHNCVLPVSDDLIFVGGTTGVWMSTDGGDTWSQEITGLDPTARVVHALALGPDGHLYAGTAGGGVVRTLSPVLDAPTIIHGGVMVPDLQLLLGDGHLQVLLPGTGDHLVRMIDPRGIELRTVRSIAALPVVFPVHDLAQGCYFIQAVPLRSGGPLLRASFVLVR